MAFPDMTREGNPRNSIPAFSRRGFLKTAVAGAAGVAIGSAIAASGTTAPSAARPAATGRAALATGDDRADNVLRALKTFEKEIARAIGKRRVVIKPNNVAIGHQLAATHADCLDGVLEFLARIGKLDGAVIAESAADGATLEGFDNYGYPKVAKTRGAKLVDLDAEGHEIVHVVDERDFRPHPVRMSKLLLDPSIYLISAGPMKTHDRVVATLSLKNVVFGAPIKDSGYGWRGSRRGSRSDKPIVHGSGIHGINYNLFAVASRVRPHLAVLDGYQGMEGNGPVNGSPVDHRVCVVSPDWLAADRVAVELMGIDFAKIGYLNYCAAAGMGEGDLSRIEVVGEPIERHRKTYRLADNIDRQLEWMNPARDRT